MSDEMPTQLGSQHGIQFFELFPFGKPFLCVVFPEIALTEPGQGQYLLRGLGLGYRQEPD